MNSAILLAAGHGTRSKVPQKQYAQVGGKPLLWYSLNALSKHSKIEKVVVVIQSGDETKFEQWIKEWGFKNVEWVRGGESRQASATLGFKKLAPKPNDIVLFHNAANPFVTVDEITHVIEAAQDAAAAFVAQPVNDTLKQVKDGRVVKTLDRSEVWQAQTPQALRADLYQSALVATLTGTDEMSLVEGIGVQPVVVPASANNIKITTPRDLEFARFLIEGGATLTGIGKDSHRFDANQKGLTLGGLELPNEPKMLANSDGDVMIHALCNALLQTIGAQSLGTIADDMVKLGIKDSRDYLKKVLELINDHNLKIVHVGFQLEGAHPKIDPLNERLTQSLAELLEISSEHIGITATTGEDLTPFGRGEGLQCLVTVNLKPR